MLNSIGRIWRSLWTAPLAPSGPGYEGSRPWAGPLDLDDYGRETSEMRRTYRDIHRKEPSVKAAIEGKVASVAALDAIVKPKDKNNPLDRRVAEFCRDAVADSDLGWPGLISQVAKPGFVDGWSLMEITLGPVHSNPKWRGLWGIADLRPLDTEFLKLRTDDYRHVTAIVSTARGMQTYPRDKFILFTQGSMYGNPFGSSELRAAFRSANLIENAYKVWWVCLHYYGQPFLKGTYSKQANKVALENAIMASRAGGWINLSKDEQLEVINLANATSYQAFEAKVMALRQEIFLAIRGSYLPFTEGTQQDATGNTAISKVASDAVEYLVAFAVAQAIRRDLFTAIVRPNFGHNVAIPDLLLGGTNWAEVMQRLEIAIKVLNEIGLPLDAESIYNLAVLEPPSSPENAIRPRPAPVAFPGMLTAASPNSPVGSQPLRPATEEDQGLEPLPEPATYSTFAALPGPSGDKLANIIAGTAIDGADVLLATARKAITRLLADDHWKKAKTLFTDAELMTLSKAIGKTTITANLLGRTRVLGSVPMATKLADAELPNAGDVLNRLPNRVPSLVPEQALAYFRNLVPTLGADANLLLPTLERQAFTLAVATEQTLLTKVQDIISDRLATGKVGDARLAIDDVLEQAGVSPRNMQYGELIMRTNAMDAYNRGASEQIAGMEDIFPVWQYAGIRDGRQGEDHEPHFDRYYPASASFETVRGSRVWNCRCVAIPVDKFQWSELQASGARVESSW